MEQLEKKVIMGMIVAVFIYAAIALYMDVQALMNRMTLVPVSVFIGALGLSTVNYVLRFGKWQFFLRVLGLEVPRGRSALVFVAGMSMSITPGKFGEVLKSLLLRDSDGIPAATTAPVILAERVADMLGLIVIASVGIGAFQYGESALIGSLLVILAFLLWAQKETWVMAVLDAVERVPVVGASRGKFEEAYRSTRALLGLKNTVIATLFSVGSWSFEALAFYWIVQTLGGEATMQVAFFIYATGTILGGISFLPGGLGITEGSMIGALILLGVFGDDPTAAAATYLIRFATLWFGVLLGFIALGLFRRSYGKSA